MRRKSNVNFSVLPKISPSPSGGVESNYSAHSGPTHRCFPQVRVWQKRLNDGNNNGQAMHGARKSPGPKFISVIGNLFVVWSKYTNTEMFVFGYLD